jgi:hypothetical protein
VIETIRAGLIDLLNDTHVTDRPPSPVGASERGIEGFIADLRARATIPGAAIRRL